MARLPMFFEHAPELPRDAARHSRQYDSEDRAAGKPAGARLSRAKKRLRPGRRVPARLWNCGTRRAPTAQFACTALPGSTRAWDLNLLFTMECDGVRDRWSMGSWESVPETEGTDAALVAGALASQRERQRAPCACACAPAPSRGSVGPGRMPASRPRAEENRRSRHIAGKPNRCAQLFVRPPLDRGNPAAGSGSRGRPTS